MPDAFDSNAQDVGLSLDSIESEIRAGLYTHADRLVAAYDNEEFYACRNTPYIAPRESEDWRDFLKRPKRTSKLTHAVVTKLAKGLYTPGPTRRLKAAAGADAFLQQVYVDNHINALMKQVDRHATLNGYAAVQVHATGRPEKPIVLYLWGAHETVVWTWPDDPSEPWAVATITREYTVEGYVKMQRVRYDAWSRDEHRVYRTRWLVYPTYDVVHQNYRSCFGQTAVFMPGLSGFPAGSGKNPYGVLPFATAHNEPVVSDFYEGGLGNALSDCNAEIDRELSDLADHVREFMNPDRFVTGVSADWRRERTISRWQRLVPGKNGDGEAAEPKAAIVQAELATMEVWENASRYANATLEDLDVPLVAIHSDASTDLSGIAIVAKHIPLLERTKERQPLFVVAETDLASVVLVAAGNYYGQPQLALAGEVVELDLVWPAPRFPLPTPERDLADAWEMDNGVKSLVDVVAERGGITEPAAWDKIERVIADNKKLKAMMPPPDKLDAQGNVIDPNADDDPEDDDDDDSDKPEVEDDDAEK